MMNYYAQGGLANVAENLATRGRNGDTQLIHVSPEELHGLQALAKANGTSLTMNPDTGLPEAFNFKKLIPMIAGGALAATGVGAPMAALMVGGAYTAGTGSLQEGLMAGIGAYGGAGLGAGIASAGTSAAVEAGGQAAVDQAVSGAASGATSGATSGAASGVGDVFAGYSPTGSAAGTAANTVNAGTAGATGSNALSTAQNAINSQAFPNLGEQGIAGLKEAAARAADPMDVVRSAGMGNVANSAQVANPTIGQGFSNMGSGIERLGSQQGISAAYNAAPTGTFPALAATALDASQKQASSAPVDGEDEYERRLKGYRLSPDYQPYVAPRPNPYYRPTYAAAGGVMESFDDETGNDMARGGVASLGGYSDGGRMLKGPGDGMSDSIPGVIGGKQPARLADGEFVVPADVVSHLGNGSTDAGAKKLYSMMDKVRQARTGKKKQAPQVNVNKYLPTGKASGGITGYASGGMIGYATGGEVAALYDSVLGRQADPAGLEYWTNSGLSTAEIAQALASSPEARSNPTVMGNQVNQIFQQQFGRDAEQTAQDFYGKALASGQSFADVSKGIAQAKEGQDLDKQGIASVYRQVMGRNPEPAGQQYWFSVAQREGLTADQLKDRITTAAAPELAREGITPGTKFENLDLAALESDPFAGYYSDKSIYDVADDAENVSMIDGRRVQFATPVTRQAVVSKFIDGVYTANPGVDIINEPHIQAAINTARDNGTLTETSFNNLVNSLKPVNGVPKTAAETRAILAAPQARVIVDNLYAQQIGEDANIAKAEAEAAGRQGVLSGQDPGYYQSNRVLSDAYTAAGLTVPFNYANYQGVDTRDRTSNVVTPENLADKQNSLLNSLNRNNPYRTTYQPLTRGISNMPDSVQDPYSDAGLQFLYGQMMNQYAPPPVGQVNPATFVSNAPYTYTPPPQNNLTLKTPVVDSTKPVAPVNNYFTAPNGQVFASQDAYNASVSGSGGG
jgi:hypothetical protein